MNNVLTPKLQREFEDRGVSRRNFGRIAAMISAGAAAMPFLSEPALAQLSQIKGKIPDDAVMINSNENPLGPCKEAADAAHAMIAQGGRYLFNQTSEFQQLLAEQEGLKANYVVAYAGSSAPLMQSAIAFTSPKNPFVTGDPGYEAGERSSSAMGARVIRVPLTKTYAHDVRAMAAADPNAGLIYLCNPNNPSGTLTPPEDIEWLVENKPKGSVLMIDEAYTHIAGAPFSTKFVAQDKDVIVLRTFSKIYGMAGLRAGAAIARPDLLAKLGKYSGGMMPITGMAAAIASLKAKYVIPERREKIGNVRNDLQAFLDKHDIKYVPSVSNCIMIDVGQRKTNDVIEGLRAEKVYIGRVWQSWPTKVRVTIGLPSEMEKFKAAWLKVMA
jgi:histidinol-phosphate/aromatic aminotransferase/cobyric acid decarboxylase-like protein